MLNINHITKKRKKELVYTLNWIKVKFKPFFLYKYKVEIDMININQWRIQGFLELGHQLSFYLQSIILHVEFIKSKGIPAHNYF